MESKMDGLVSDIQILANSLYSYKRPQWQSQQQLSPVRRIRSSTANSKSSIKKRSSIGRQFPSFRRNSRTGSASSASSSDSIRGRSSSASSSRKGEKGWSSSSAGGGLGDRSISVEGSWTYSNIAIPELPESPSLSSVASCSYSSAASSQDSSMSGTFQKRAEVATSPTPPYWQSTQQCYSSLVTSTPNMQYCGTEIAASDSYYTLPSKTTTKGKRQHSMMFSSDHLNEVDGCLEEESPLSSEKSFIVRRSSLTGQLEQFQSPHSKERNAGVMLHGGTSGYRVLNKGVKKSLKRRSSSKLDQVILPSVETTV